MQIYTRTGDHGTTKLIGGMEVPKDDARIEAYGTIDELNSLVGCIASLPQLASAFKEELVQIQHYLFDCGNDLATPTFKEMGKISPRTRDTNDPLYPYVVQKETVEWLEARIDSYANIPPEVNYFILPGGTNESAQLHLARTVTRRAERQMVTFQKQGQVNPFALKFVNRLSDYFFALARVVNAQAEKEDVRYERSKKVFHTDLTKDDIK
ncbi:cob(I)yrinic acid a,c-diamide adenosyltransferase [Tetragenococcus koreensis]|uniref:Corrinoid adenosyltransferase n=1 Tax=Tetragenococcus koreensis TaxID=290335 RepID=A0AAN4RIJ6_9ENTE|nr:cob(I)yrinic acid a,c-diamide adenosyltransferase [Tetragenococcus koreensis]MCF1584612.1 cob(I)yrinic acid a,c-diamide adenosyltransferase [Tetragenococcus koreensis]MCF1614164.1 cob(I)yrinic acid a,c-diamide adenosyltransferase [Tetragenococcus koreensis]MCF1617402.1 cob(I)yrinic acid a,c-diamide adenosyltransferase [Tetragenococcus koreensis]MCF1619700.1 cob(I)yrinic acid a,c-diamide adenosyltransferase [Tetragenococcus koreensis]MCF1622190.1 cob(I)yrinic acid a,c-diamide adenosyltransfe